MTEAFQIDDGDPDAAATKHTPAASIQSLSGFFHTNNDFTVPMDLLTQPSHGEEHSLKDVCATFMHLSSLPIKCHSV